MKRKWMSAFFLALFVVFTLAMVLLLRGGGTATTASQARIAVIAYGSGNTDRWSALEQGIRQACRELEIEMPSISVAPPGDTRTQLSFLQREIDAGAKGVLLATEDSDVMAQALAETAPTLPIVYILNAPTGETAIAADDAALARALAAQLASETGHIAVVSGTLHRDGVRERFDAFMAAMAEQGLDAAVLTSAPGQEMRRMLSSQLTFRQPAIDVLVALDTDTLESAIDAAESAVTDARIVGIGASDKVVNALDRGILDGVVFQNEYAVGYLGMMQLAARMNLTKMPPQGDIQWMYVDRETMFSYDAERLLFPFTP